MSLAYYKTPIYCPEFTMWIGWHWLWNIMYTMCVILTTACSKQLFRAGWLINKNVA